MNNTDRMFRAVSRGGDPVVLQFGALANAIDTVCDATEAPIVKGSLVYEIDNLICAAAAIDLPGIPRLYWFQIWGWLARLPLIESRAEAGDDVAMTIISDPHGADQRVGCHQEQLLRWLGAQLDSPTIGQALRAYDLWLWTHVKRVAAELGIEANRAGTMTRRQAGRSTARPRDLRLRQWLMATDMAVAT